MCLTRMLSNSQGVIHQHPKHHSKIPLHQVLSLSGESLGKASMHTDYNRQREIYLPSKQAQLETYLLTQTHPDSTSCSSPEVTLGWNYEDSLISSLLSCSSPSIPQRTSTPFLQLSWIASEHTKFISSKVNDTFVYFYPLGHVCLEIQINI